MIYNLNYSLVDNTDDWGKTLMFIDFDGTVIKTYNSNQIQGLTRLPALPDHTNDDIPLTSQGWNWTLSEIKSYNLLWPTTPITVGPLYYTTDGKTHVVCDLNDGNVASIYIEGKAEVDWLDGTVETVEDNSVSHTLTGNHYTIRPLTTSYGIRFDSYMRHIKCGRYLCNLDIADNQSATRDAFAKYLTTISTSPDINKIKIFTISGAPLMKAIVLPYFNTSYTSKPEYWIYTKDRLSHSDSLKAVASSYIRTLPSNLDGKFYLDSRSCCRFSIPDNVGSCQISTGYNTSIRSDIVLYGMRRVDKLAICFAYEDNIILGDTLERVDNYIYLSNNVTTVIFKGTTPPRYSGMHHPFHLGLPLVIYVPYSADHSVLNAYKTTAPWDRYTSLIQESPQ